VDVAGGGEAVDCPADVVVVPVDVVWVVVDPTPDAGAHDEPHRPRRLCWESASAAAKAD
jgi:hypothetical protein